jgi:hypothetical protein
MASDSQPLSDDPFDDSPLETPAPTVLPIFGRRNEYYKWTKEQHTDFIKWWEETPWVIETAGTSLDTKKDLMKRLHWDSTTRSSKYWGDYVQVANSTSGEPFVVCRICNASLCYPNVRSSGTNLLKNHRRSKGCRYVEENRPNGLLRSFSVVASFSPNPVYSD